MSSSSCFLTCVQISQEAGQVVWYSHLFQNLPQFIVIHTVKGFGIVNKAEIDVYLELSCFFDDPADVGNLISVSSVFSETSLNFWKFTVHSSLIDEAWNILNICKNRENSIVSFHLLTTQLNNHRFMTSNFICVPFHFTPSPFCSVLRPFPDIISFQL